VSFGEQHRRLAVDEEITLSSRAQHEAAATESSLSEQLEQSIHARVPPRLGRLRNLEPTGRLGAPMKASW